MTVARALYIHDTYTLAGSGGPTRQTLEGGGEPRRQDIQDYE